MIILNAQNHTTMQITPQSQRRKLRQLKYLLRQFLPKNRSKLSAGRQKNLVQRFQKLYARCGSLPLSRKLRQAALALAVALGLQPAQAQVTFAPPVANPFNISASGFSVYSADLVDIDGDGDMDLVYGDYATGGTYGPVLFYQQNTGTPGAPNFAAPIANPFGITLNSNGSSAAPQFADVDGDGDMDLMVTYYDYGSYYINGVEYFQNTGTTAVPAFAAPVLNPFGITGNNYNFPNVNLHDIDSDGDVDLFAGEMYGYSGQTAIRYQPNTGSATAPAFGTAQTNPFLPANPFPSGAILTYMDFADLDGDGDLDLFVNYYDYYGSYQYRIGYFENTGTATAPAFSNFNNNIYNITLPANTRYRDLVFGDVDGDGDDDLLAFNRLGGVVYYENLTPSGPRPVLNFDSTSINVNEGMGMANVSVNIMNSGMDTVRVDLSLLPGGTATNGLDMVVVPPTTLTFPPNSSMPQTFAVPITDDAIVEGNEQFSLALTSPSGFATLGNNDTLVVNIIDNDFGAPIINFDTAAYTVAEGGGTVVVPVTITNPNTSTTTAQVSIGALSSADNNDVVFNSPANLSFGSSSSVTLNLNIPIVDDALFEGTEQLILTLGNVTNGGSVGTVGSTTIEITDNEAVPVVNYAEDSTTVNEAVGTVDLTLTLSGAAQDTATVDVLVNLTSTATNGLDYTLAVPQTVVFPSGDTAAVLRIPIIDDGQPESTEVIDLGLGNPSSNVVLGMVAGTKVGLVDNDTAIGTTQLADLGASEAYPNPFDQHLTIEMAQPAGRALRVVNALGQVLLDRRVQARQTHLKTAALPLGTYWVQVYDPKTGAALWQQKLVHQ